MLPQTDQLPGNGFVTGAQGERERLDYFSVHLAQPLVEWHLKEPHVVFRVDLDEAQALSEQPLRGVAGTDVNDAP